MFTLHANLSHTPLNQFLSQEVSSLSSGCGGENQFPFLVDIVAVGIKSIDEKKAWSWEYDMKRSIKKDSFIKHF